MNHRDSEHRTRLAAAIGLSSLCFGAIETASADGGRAPQVQALDAAALLEMTSIHVFDADKHDNLWLMRAYTFTEDFEGFAPGPLHGQFGWLADPGTLMTSVPVPHFGAVTPERVSAGSGVGAFAGRSPLPPSGDTADIFECDVLIQVDDGATAATFDLHDPASGFITTRIFFQPGGVIEVLQSDGGVGSFFASTVGAWAPGVPTHIKVEVEPNGLLRVEQDGVQIFLGADIVAAATGVRSGFNQVRFIQFEFGVGGMMAFDNVVFDSYPPPCPADLDGDGQVNGTDLGIVLLSWGPCP